MSAVPFNDDDALELFKNTLPSASASFMEIKCQCQLHGD